MKPPFQLPIRADGVFLVASDQELICKTESATEQELNFIVAAVNRAPSNPTVYVVVRGGCVAYVSSTDSETEVHVLDMDDIEDAGQDVEPSELVYLAEAQRLPRIW